MPRKPRGVGVSLRAVHVLERGRDLRVESDPSRLGDLLGENFLDQGVRELVAAKLGKLLDNVRAQRLLEQLEQTLAGDVVDERLDLVDAELATYDRSDRQRVVAGLREPIEPLADDLTDLGWDGRVQVPLLGGGAMTLFCDQANDLGYEQGIAVCSLVHSDGELVIGRRAEGALEEGADVSSAQSVEANSHRLRFASELGEGLGERVPSRHLDVAICPYDQYRRARQLCRHELEQC